jgi:hypothetical protein
MLRMKFVLFSMLVSSSFLAAYDVSTFYFIITYGTFSFFRAITIFAPFTAQTYEMSHPECLIRLVEAIYLARSEEDLVREEEGYMMLMEVMRSPELAKALTGSGLKGETHPARDNLAPEMRKKLAHLEELERKGYDVADLKAKVMDLAD